MNSCVKKTIKESFRLTDIPCGRLISLLPMIQLTRLNQHALWVNPDLLKYVETTPDTVITLLSGEKIVVLEAVEVIVERLIEFRRRLLDGMLFCGVGTPQELSCLRPKADAVPYREQSPGEPNQEPQRG